MNKFFLRLVTALLCISLIVASLLPALAEETSENRLIVATETNIMTQYSTEVLELLSAGTPYTFLRAMNEEEARQINEEFPEEFSLIRYLSPSTGEETEAWVYGLVLPAEKPELREGTQPMTITIPAADGGEPAVYEVYWADRANDNDYFSPIGRNRLDFAAELVSKALVYVREATGLEPETQLGGRVDIGHADQAWWVDLVVDARFGNMFMFSEEGELEGSNLLEGGNG